MNYTSLYDQLAKASAFSPDIPVIIKPYLMPRSITSPSLIDVNRYDLFFVKTGIMSLHKHTSNQIIHFIQPGDIVPDSYLDQHKLTYHTLEDCELIYFERDALSRINAHHPHIYYLIYHILRSWIQSTSIQNDLLALPKNKRKGAFKQIFPDLPMRIPNFVIANYLAMSPEYFSRTGW